VALPELLRLQCPCNVLNIQKAIVRCLKVSKYFFEHWNSVLADGLEAISKIHVLTSYPTPPQTEHPTGGQPHAIPVPRQTRHVRALLMVTVAVRSSVSTALAAHP
jgi:hypothetical protein